MPSRPLLSARGCRPCAGWASVCRSLRSLWSFRSFVLLLTVYRLVVKYPGHLFSPGEFKTVEDYLCATHNELYLRKVEAEVAALNASVPMPGSASTAGAPAAGAQQVGNAGRVAGEAGATQPGTDRPEADGVRGEGAMTLATYRGIEARAVDEMERIYGISFVRGAVMNIGKRRVVVDAVVIVAM